MLIAGCGLAVAQESAPKEEKKPKGGETEKKKDPNRKKKDKEKEKDKGKDKDKKKGEGKDGVKDSGSGRMSLPLVEGNDSKGLKIPYYDVEGDLQMIFTIGIATRLDADRVKMQETKVETFNEEGEVDMTVQLPTSVLDLNTRIISSETATTIQREDFVITGDTVQFNTVTKQGTLIGNVRMVVNNLNEAVPTSTPEQPNEP